MPTRSDRSAISVFNCAVIVLCSIRCRLVRGTHEPAGSVAASRALRAAALSPDDSDDDDDDDSGGGDDDDGRRRRTTTTMAATTTTTTAATTTTESTTTPALAWTSHVPKERAAYLLVCVSGRLGAPPGPREETAPTLLLADFAAIYVIAALRVPTPLEEGGERIRRGRGRRQVG